MRRRADQSGAEVAAAYIGSADVFDQAIAAFGEAYAEQNERDYTTLLEAIDSGRVKAKTGL